MLTNTIDFYNAHTKTQQIHLPTASQEQGTRFNLTSNNNQLHAVSGQKSKSN